MSEDSQTKDPNQAAEASANDNPATLQPVSAQRHGDKHWQRFSSYAFAAGDVIAPLVAQELPKAVMHMPIALMKGPEGEYMMVAVQGFRPGQNLLVAPDGRWLAGYTPAYYRGYPFRLAKASEDQMALCVNEESGLISDGPDGEAFFDNGVPTKAVKDVFDFLQKVEANRQITRSICHQLQELGLIKHWALKVKEGESETALEGLFCIDENRLSKLDGEQLMQLRHTKALPLIYCQILSMQHISRLEQLAGLHSKHKQKSVPKELDLEFLNGQNGNISFDKL